METLQIALSVFAISIVMNIIIFLVEYSDNNLPWYKCNIRDNYKTHKPDEFYWSIVKFCYIPVFGPVVIAIGFISVYLIDLVEYIRNISIFHKPTNLFIKIVSMLRGD